MSSPAAQISVIHAIRAYVNKMVEIPGMKALVMDEETTTILSMVTALSDVIAKDVVLTERLLDPTAAAPPGTVAVKQEAMPHMKAIVFVRPSKKSVDALAAALRRPRFKEYHIFFSNFVGEASLKVIAEADDFELVKQVQEYYADYVAVNRSLWHLALPHVRSLYQPDAYWGDAERRVLQRSVQGVLSLLLSLKRRPQIRYTRRSELCRRLAFDVQRRIGEESEVFHSLQGTASLGIGGIQNGGIGAAAGAAAEPLLLVLDRRDDPVTPLLLQWTYQAMVHELIGIHNNRVDLSKVPNVKPDMKEVVLSHEQDEFFNKAMYLNFGDLGGAIKGLVMQYQKTAKLNQNIATVEDMRRFVDDYPEFRRLSGNVSKHVALMSEMSRLVDQRELMRVSELEQTLACQGKHSAALEMLYRILNSTRVTDEDRLRLVCLYALRYEAQNNELASLKALLREKAFSVDAERRVAAIDGLLAYAGKAVRTEDLFKTEGLWNRFTNVVASGVDGVENIYTQHKPLLFSTLDALHKGKLRPAEYPYLDQGPARRHQEVFVFIVGGVTFEEEVAVHNFNEANPDMRVVLGGTSILNSRSFISDVLSISPRGGAAADDDEDDAKSPH